MSAYLIVDIHVHDPGRYKGYVEQVQAFVEKHQGTYLVRGGDTVVKEGDWMPGRLVVLSFPSRCHANAFLSDPEYQAIATIRHAAANTNLVLADGY